MLNKGTKNKIRKNSEQTLACNNCATINDQGANFCNNCGLGLK
jgi:rRNA maturation endonuclease Nob1